MGMFFDGAPILQTLGQFAAPNSVLGQQQAKQQLQQASLAYLDPNTDPRTKAQAASALMQSGVSLADLAKYEEQQRIGQFQQGSLEALKNWQQSQNQPVQPAPQAPMSPSGAPAQPLQQPLPQMPAQPKSSLADLAPLLLNPQTAGFAQQVLKQEQDAANRAFEQQKFQAEQQRQSPEAEAARQEAQAKGKAMAEKKVVANSLEANLPKLGGVVQSLSDLGKSATYSVAGRGVDYAREQLLGMQPRESSVARADYISKVDNEVLPLLRDTFGAQFTQKEGESLKATLGDPDAPPAKKDAVLRSFITAKINQVQTTRKELGMPPAEIPDSILKLQDIGKQKAETNDGGVVTTQAQFDALPSGALYKEADGKTYRKP